MTFYTCDETYFEYASNKIGSGWLLVRTRSEKVIGKDGLVLVIEEEDGGAREGITLEHVVSHGDVGGGVDGRHFCELDGEVADVEVVGDVRYEWGRNVSS